MTTQPEPVTGVDPVRVDVVVVGAGIAGAAAAATLARRGSAGSRIVLVEREPLPAQHASGRSASVLSETSGHPTVCALARLSRTFFEEPPEGFADHPLLSPRGLVWVGEAGDHDALDRLAEVGHRVRPSVSRLDARETAALLPGWNPEAIAAGGVHEPEAMAIDTAATIDGFLRDFRRHGGTIALQAEAIEVRPARGARWSVATGNATFDTALVVDAAGAWADELAGRAGLTPLGLRPLRRTAALVPTPGPPLDWPLVMDVAGRYYCEPETGGLLVSPADETDSAPCDAQPDELDVALALERVRDATNLPLRSVRRAWAGLRTFAPDRIPVVGEDPRAPGFWWLAGQGGAGIKTAPAMAELLADLIETGDVGGGAAELGLMAAELSPVRFT